VPAASVGIIANPASGKDIRRLVAHASMFDNGEKSNIIRRVLLGLVEAGVENVLYMPDPNHLVDGAAERLDLGGLSLESVPIPGAASAIDTERAAAAMSDAACAVVITLGGDGTNRAVARGWRDVPLIAISTGTNNVFPVMVEGTLAGVAAGLVARGAVSLEEAASQTKTIHVQIEGESDDLALVDAALLDERWIGSRAVWQPHQLRQLLLARAEPASLGLSAIGGLLCPVEQRDDSGLLVVAGGNGMVVSAPIVPGNYLDVPVGAFRRVALGESLDWTGPGVLAFDGERDRRLQPGQQARLSVHRNGPRVLSIDRVLHLAACRQTFVRRHGSEDGD